MNNNNDKSSRRYGTRSTSRRTRARSTSRNRYNKNNSVNASVSSTRKNKNSTSRSLGRYIPSTEKKISTVYLKDNKLFIRKPEDVKKGIPVKGKIKGDTVWLVRETSKSESKFKYGRTSTNDTYSTLEVWDELPENIIEGIEDGDFCKSIRKKDGGKTYTWKSEWYNYEATQFKLEDAE